MCNKHWPWGKWPCPTNDTGDMMQWNRTGPMPVENKAVLDWCPQTTDVKCGEKPTIATTTMATSPTQADAEKDPNVTEKQEEGGFPWWVILVIFAALALLAAIIALLVMRAKKKILKPTSVATGKKSEQKSSKATPSTKSSTSLSTPTGKSMDGKSMDRKSVSLWHNVKQGGAEDSMLVNLRDTTMVDPRGKTGGMIGKVSGKKLSGTKSSMIPTKSIVKSLSVSKTMGSKKGGKK